MLGLGIDRWWTEAPLKMSEKKGEYKRAFKALEQSLANIIDQVKFVIFCVISK